MSITIPDDLPYSPLGIECIRFGGRRGNLGIGCCAVDILQGFSLDPYDTGRSTPFYDGDTQQPIFGETGEQLHIGGTNEEMLLAYLTHGSFSADPQPDHAFIAVLSDEQLSSSGYGREWLKILYREGFDYVTSVNNSVYQEDHVNHIFILIRNAGGYIDSEESLQVPEVWKKLEKTERQTPEERYRELCRTYEKAHEYLPAPDTPYEGV